MYRTTVLAALALLVTGCATDPRAGAAQFSTAAVEQSPQCKVALERAAAYDNNTGPRVAAALALGFLGPAGVLGSAALDVQKNMERGDLNAAVTEYCGPAPAAALADQKRCAEVEGVMKCE